MTIRNTLFNAARRGLARLGVGMVPQSTLDVLTQKARAFDLWNPHGDAALMAGLRSDQAIQYLNVVKQGRAQLRQDLFVLTQLDFKRHGFFVDVGATNGIDLSNTYLLETAFQWRGIVAEPARRWQAALRANRSAAIETRCVWRTTGSVVNFREVHIGELSTIDEFSAGDTHSEARRRGRTYEVGTISLNDLLHLHQAPRVIDFLSIDTEGSEYEILKAVDFDRYSFSVITCEHNHTPKRDRILQLLSGHGYVRKFENLSRFDDWYVKA